MSLVSRQRVGFAAAVLVSLAAACRHEDKGSAPSCTATAPPARPPLDRLAPGELGASSRLVFGFPVPEGMAIKRTYPDASYLTGHVPAKDLVHYVRKHTNSQLVELQNGRTVFSNVRLLGGDPKRRYRIEVSDRGKRSLLTLVDTTPAPSVPGLTPEERWKRVGLRPDGTPLDVHTMK